MGTSKVLTRAVFIVMLFIPVLVGCGGQSSYYDPNAPTYSSSVTPIILYNRSPVYPSSSDHRLPNLRPGQSLAIQVMIVGSLQPCTPNLDCPIVVTGVVSEPSGINIILAEPLRKDQTVDATLTVDPSVKSGVYRIAVVNLQPNPRESNETRWAEIRIE